MAFRGNESPMEGLEWEKGYGPSDPTSPFHKFAMANDKKRSHTAFTSPGKSNFPQLSQPNGKPYFFNSPAKDAPTSPYRNPSFTTPRKNYDFDFSSGPESSPVPQTENEDTPDIKPLPAIPSELQPKEKKRNSLFNFYGRFAPSSGKGEIKKPTSDVLSKRIYKKRRQAQTFKRELALARRESEDSGSDDDDTPQPVKSKRSRSKKDLPPRPEEVGWMTMIFTFIHTYPDAPSIIAKYLQVFFNAAILAGCLFMFYSFYATIRADVDKASEDAMAEVMSEISACHKSYIDNRCGAASRLPALEQVCANWELCMNRDAGAIKRARLSAHTFAEIFNSFVEPISLKTMVFTIVIVILALLVNNATFTLYRKSQEHHPQDQWRSGSAQYGMHPGPHAGNMGQFGMTPGLPYQTPHQYGWQVEDQRQQQQLQYNQSPSKGRGRSRSPEKKMLKLTD